jgi:Tol biopolymer transport system component
VRTVAEPERYSDPTFSPDGSRVVVRKSPETVGDIEIYTFDVATGKGNLIAKSNQITFSNMLWSPDGKQVFYVVNRPGGFGTIIRKAADGSGSEEELFRYTPGAPVNINDITPDGKFLTFDSGGVILILPLTGGDSASRQAIEIARDENFFFGGRFSPDGRSIAYLWTGTDRSEMYVQAFDPVSGKLGESKLQLTKDGVSSIVSWRADGRELYYRKGDMSDSLTMSVAVTTAPRLQASTPQFLFRGAGAGGAKNITRDGQRFVVVVPRD